MRRPLLAIFCSISIGIFSQITLADIESGNNIPHNANTPAVATMPASDTNATETSTSTTSTPVSLHKHWCERHPERCEEMRAEKKERHEKWCKKHPKKCEKMKARQENKQSKDQQSTPAATPPKAK